MSFRARESPHGSLNITKIILRCCWGRSMCGVADVAISTQWPPESEQPPPRGPNDPNGEVQRLNALVQLNTSLHREDADGVAPVCVHPPKVWPPVLEIRQPGPASLTFISMLRGRDPISSSYASCHLHQYPGYEAHHYHDLPGPGRTIL